MKKTNTKKSKTGKTVKSKTAAKAKSKAKTKTETPALEAKETTGKFYEFSQNNSGGIFVTNKTLCHRLFIEANDAQDATEKAESLGVYFNGVASGRDCPCCGDRWYDSPSEYIFPHNYGTFRTNLHDLPKAKMVKLYKVKTVDLAKSGKEYKVIFPSIKEFAQYCADQYGWTVPDSRIFYMNGAVLEINTNKNTRKTSS